MYRESRPIFASAAAYDVWARGNRAQMDMFTGGDVDVPLMLANLEKGPRAGAGGPWIYENVSLTYLLMMESSLEPVPTVASIEELLKKAADVAGIGCRPAWP